MKRYIMPILIIAAVLYGQFSSVHTALIMSPTYHLVMHILGGLGIGLLARALVSRSPIGKRKKMALIILAAFAAGLLWEIIEVYFNVTGRILWSDAYFMDTTKDLLNDMIGGMIVAAIERFKPNN